MASSRRPDDQSGLAVWQLCYQIVDQMVLLRWIPRGGIQRVPRGLDRFAGLCKDGLGPVLGDAEPGLCVAGLVDGDAFLSCRSRLAGDGTGGEVALSGLLRRRGFSSA
jgi:hypothetical protein